VINDPLFDFVVTLCIILNTVFLAIEHHGMSEDLKHVLDTGNKVWTSGIYAAGRGHVEQPRHFRTGT
jgi:hypothetical protein